MTVRSPSSDRPRVAAEPYLAVHPAVVPWSQTPAAVTVTWRSGDASPWEVFVARDGGEERPFATGAEGSQAAEWIAQGSVYEFRLYPPGRDGQPVATATARMRGRGEPVDQGSARRASIRVDPNPVPVHGSSRARVSWDTGDGSDGVVTVITDADRDRREAVVAASPSGAIEIEWIRRDVVYRFRLYRADEPKRTIAQTTVAMGSERSELVADVAVLAGIVLVPASILLVGYAVLRRVSRSLSRMIEG